MLFTKLQKDAKKDMKEHMATKGKEHALLLAQARARKEFDLSFKEVASTQ